MDDLVKQALAKWPNVPNCYGWLALDARGHWRIGAERQLITHTAIIAFINRNYLADEQGRWLFQNGPQRVYVSLDYTPYVWQLLPTPEQGLRLVDQTETPATLMPSAIWLDSDGRFLIQAGERIGVLHDHDSALLSEWLCDKNGKLLDETNAAEHIDSLLNHPDQKTQLWLRWMGESQSVMPVNGIVTAQVATRFGFDPKPEQGQS